MSIDPEHHEYASRLIRFKVHRICRRRGIPKSDEEVIEHDLWAHLALRMARYDPSRGQITTFIDRIVERWIISYLRHRFADKRDPRREECSLNEPLLDANDREIDWHETTLEEASTHQRLQELERDMAQVNPTHVPHVLRERRQWVCWKYICRGGKQTKCPINPRNGGRASSTDPETWLSFDEAVAAWQAGGHAGIGYVFATVDPFCGIDLDGCIDDAGAIVPAAREIIDALNSYTEVSPSGRGIKVFIAGAKPDDARCRSKAIEGYKETEVYDRERFFAVTSRHVPGTPIAVEERQAELDALCDRLWPKKRPSGTAAHAPANGFTGDDEALVEQAGAARNGDRFKRLFAGDTSIHGDDRSAADQALCNSLAFWTGRNAERMDRLFRRSGLFREKWDEKRGARTYGQMTIENAIADCQETYSASRRTPRSATSPDFAARSESSVGDDLLVPLGQPDPVTGRLVLSPRRTLPTAEAYIHAFNRHPEGRTLHGYGGLLMEWRGNRYVQVEDEAVKHRLQPWLHAALRYVLNRRTGEMELVDFESNPTTLRQGDHRPRAHQPRRRRQCGRADDGQPRGQLRPPAADRQVAGHHQRCPVHRRQRRDRCRAAPVHLGRGHPHGLRHTHAAELRAEGVDIGIIARQLGHRSIATTAKYLDHIAPVDVVQASRGRRG
jgi:hypothetical protein